jgi:hypothetical protein
MRKIAFIAILSMFVAAKCPAINGIGVYCHWWWPFTQEDQSTVSPRGTIVKATIQSNKVAQYDTIFKEVAEYPALSFDGKRVAFFRWGKKVQFSGGYYHVVAGTATNPNYISVINIDGTNLQNIIQVAAPDAPMPGKGEGNNEGNAVLDWPAGDWIYYEKPSKTSEMWRVNTRDPSRNEKLCSYSSSDFIRRWSLSVNAQYAGAQVMGVFNGGMKFPLVNNSINQSSPAPGIGCNAAVTCGAGFIALYEGGEHTEMVVYKWDHSANNMSAYNRHTIADLEQWLGEPLVKPGHGGADLIRCSANSEKWVLRQIGWCWQADWISMGSNSIAVNWKDRMAINLSHTSAPTADCNNGPPGTPPTNCAEAGDLWVDFGAGNENKWEDENGTLHAQAAIDPVGVIDGGAAGSGYAPPRMTANYMFFDERDGYSLIILNALGKTVKCAQGRGPASIALASLRPGAYCIAGTANGRSFSFRFNKPL